MRLKSFVGDCRHLRDLLTSLVRGFLLGLKFLAERVMLPLRSPLRLRSQPLRVPDLRVLDPFLPSRVLDLLRELRIPVLDSLRINLWSALWPS